MDSSTNKKLIWYGIGHCGLWTDDFSVLKDAGVPVCPICGMPGFQADAEEWHRGAENFDKQNPGYLAKLKSKYNNCNGAPVDLVERMKQLADRIDAEAEKYDTQSRRNRRK